MTFAHPLIVAAAVVVAVAFAAFAVRSDRRRRAAALDYSSVAFLDAVAGRAWPWTTIVALAWALAIAAGGIALARPSVVANVSVRDAAVVLCIDTSGSMASTDVYPTRSGASRAAAEAFIDGVPDGTRIGIVAFSTDAIPLGPLTSDKADARDELARLPSPDGGTAIGDALAAAAKLLPAGGRRAIVLVTDGVNNHGSDPQDVAEQIGAGGIAIFTVGIGTNGSGLLIPGTAEEPSIDEDALQAIAHAGNGSYARVADAAALTRWLTALAQTSVREHRRVDLTLPCALGGGVLALGAALAAIVLGRFP